VTGSTVPVRIAVRNLTINCAWAGKAPRAGMGHWHLLLDGGLVNMECATAAVLSMQNVAPGKHTITALLAADDHTAINVKTGTTSSTGSHTTSRWLAWNAATHTPTLTLIANYNNALSGFNFNGYGDGKMVISVPVGAHVDVHFSNKGSIPHSAFITLWSDRTSTSGFATAFKGASTANPTSGTTAGTTQTFSFVASKAGKYALVCAVPGHEAASMWDVFMVTSGGTPSVTVH
jgi:sulfocyanin